MTDAPIFIGGMYKSGTTLLRAMLGQHSNIASGLETYWFDLPWGPEHAAELTKAAGRLAGFFDLPAGEVRGVLDQAASPEDFLDRLMRLVAAHEGKARWAEKTPGNIAHTDRIWAFWPKAQVLHIIRDPRDVFASLVEARKWDAPEVFAERWASTIGKGLKRIGDAPPAAGRYMTVRYEDLILNPEPTMRGVAAFLGEPWEPALAEFSGRKDDFDKVLEATGKASTTLERLKEPLTSQRIGIWKRVLTDEQLAAIRAEIAQRGHGAFYDRVVVETPTD